MPNKTELDTLKYLTSIVKPKMRPEADKALELYKNKSIANYKTVLKIITQLSGPGGSQSAAIKTIEKYNKKPSYFKTDIKSDIKNMFAKGRTAILKADALIKTIDQQYKKFKPPKFEFHIGGNVVYEDFHTFENMTFKSICQEFVERTYKASTYQETISKFTNDMKNRIHSYSDESDL